MNSRCRPLPRHLSWSAFPPQEQAFVGHRWALALHGHDLEIRFLFLHHPVVNERGPTALPLVRSLRFNGERARCRRSDCERITHGRGLVHPTDERPELLRRHYRPCRGIVENRSPVDKHGPSPVRLDHGVEGAPRFPFRRSARQNAFSESRRWLPGPSRHSGNSPQAV
jgi:hypothetical protein